MSRENILLLGGTGFIGSALSRRLDQEKRTTHILSSCPARDVDVRAVVLDIGRICRELQWAPKVGLYEGTRRTWECLRGS